MKLSYWRVLFVADPTEHHDLAKSAATDAHIASILANLTAALTAAVATKFQTSSIPGYDNCTTTQEFVAAHQGFGGPICYNGSIPGL